MQSRLAVIMVADIVGYTAIMANDEVAGIEAVQEINDRFLEPQAAASGGEILKRLGDGWIVAFGSVHSGIEFATKLLEALNGHPKIKVRIGSHFGDIIEDGSDFYGAGVNLAARLQSEAPPTGLMISGDLFRQLTGDIAKQFESAGSFELKNVPYPVDGFQWRPRGKKRSQASEGEIPSVLVEHFDFAPNTPDAQAHTEELRDQILMILAQRTGVRAIDATNSSDKKASYLLRGRFRMAGERARINVSMVLCETSETLFSRNYDGDVSDIFEFADKISAQISADTRIQINAFDALRSQDLNDDELSVSELRSRAANEFYKGTYESWSRARELMRRALSLNPSDPMAVAMSSMSISMLAAARFEKIESGQAQDLVDAMDDAIAGAPQSDYMYAVRSQLYSFVMRDAQPAIRDAERALDINPHYFVGHMSAASARMLNGEFSMAVEILDKSLALGTPDPLEPLRLWPLAVSLYIEKDFARASDVLERSMQQVSGVWALHKLRSLALRDLGDKDGADRCLLITERLPRRPAIVAFHPPLQSALDSLVSELKPDSTSA